MKTNLLFPLVALTILLTTSCDKGTPPIVQPIENTVYITNEGNFGSANGSITTYNPDTREIVQNAFSAVNNYNLGDVVHSMSTYGNNSYICVNQSSKVEVVETNTLLSQGTITDVPNPRFFKGIDVNKAYVSSWTFGGNSELSVIDLETLEKNAAIITGWVEEILLSNSKAFIAVADTNEVIVVDVNADILVAKCFTGFGPNSLVKDDNGQIWVLFGGKKVYNADFTLNISESTAGGLAQINPSNNTVIQQIIFSDVTSTPTNLCVSSDGKTLYYLYKGSVFEFPITITTEPTTALIDGTGKSFYGLGVHPDHGEIYVSDAIDFNQSGDVYRYTPTGVLMSSFKAGIIPGRFNF